MTTPSRRTLLRGAGRIHDQYVLLAQPRSLPPLPDPMWDQCVRISRQVTLVRQRGLPVAGNRLQRSLVRHLDLLGQQCRETATTINTVCQPAPVPGLRLLYDELAALQHEFDHVDIDLRRGELAVTTEPIVLEGVFLGPFEIRLDWYDLGDAQPYRVIALQSCPAQADSDTTHPHVQSERLCEGDARRAIRDALQSGRLSDFFLIVARTLLSYNAGSAFVSLDDWDGVRCTECDDSVHADDICHCERCSTCCCGDCVRYCSECDDRYCSECIDRCRACDEPYCTGCLDQCAGCELPHCGDCLTDEVCDDCLPAPEEVSETPAAADTLDPDPDSQPFTEIPHAHQTTATAPPTSADVRPSPPQAAPASEIKRPSSPAPTAVHTDRLGQAPVPA